MMSERRDRGDDQLSVRFWGTRGSIPMPGPETVVYGGHTCCVEIRLGQRVFLIDAGSGFEPAGRALSLLGAGSGRIDLLLSHLHHDHISGLPFFSPILKEQGELRIFCGNLEGASAEAALGIMFSPPLFPVTLDVLPGRIVHVGFRAGETLAFEDGVRVATCALRHPGGATGYRFDHGGRRVCYISDMEHVDSGPDADLVAFCRDADLVIYDAMFTETELPRCRGWGHSTWNAGVLLCRAANARALAAYHHHKAHDDAALAGIDAELAAALPGSFVAREGQTVSFRALQPLSPGTRAPEARPGPFQPGRRKDLRRREPAPQDLVPQKATPQAMASQNLATQNLATQDHRCPDPQLHHG